MKNHSQKEPLYRKENTLARDMHHNFGGDFRHDRHTKKHINSEAMHSPMAKNVKRGLDYTPLFRFLLSKVGQNWDMIYSEAVSRLDREDPIFWIVEHNNEDKSGIVRIGDYTYYHSLFVDENNLLQKINPDVTSDHINVYCDCHTWSLDGKAIKVSKEQVAQTKKELGLI